MLIVMKSSANEEQISVVKNTIEKYGFTSHIVRGDIHTVICGVGGKIVDTRELELLDGVEKVVRIMSPYKLVSRVGHEEDTVIDVKGVKIGGKKITIMAGPCSVESFEQMDETASKLAACGVKILRGGAFKPRTSPYAFQGLKEEGLKIMKKVADKYNMLVVSEVMEISQIETMMDYVDIFQVGARNMQNFNLLSELGLISKPVVLKRGFSSTIQEWLMAAEYIMAGGNHDVILCERGIRTFETATRNTLDISAVPTVKKLSHLPIIVDPSHATGLRDQVAPLSKAAIAAGADGLIIEVHNNPEKALCDGAQSLYPKQFKELYGKLKIIAKAVDRQL